MPRRSRSNIGRSTRDASRKRLRLNNETEEEREIRLFNRRESNYLRRNRETFVEREIRLSLDRARHRSQRARESCIEREIRLIRDKDTYRPQRSNLRSNKVNSAMNYESCIEYKNDPISIVCEYCSALKCKDESESLCCLQGKIKLEEILTCEAGVGR